MNNSRNFDPDGWTFGGNGALTLEELKSSDITDFYDSGKGYGGPYPAKNFVLPSSSTNSRRSSNSTSEISSITKPPTGITKRPITIVNNPTEIPLSMVMNDNTIPPVYIKAEKGLVRRSLSSVLPPKPPSSSTSSTTITDKSNAPNRSGSVTRKYPNLRQAKALVTEQSSLRNNDSITTGIVLSSSSSSSTSSIRLPPVPSKSPSTSTISTTKNVLEPALLKEDDLLADMEARVERELADLDAVEDHIRMARQQLETVSPQLKTNNTSTKTTNNRNSSPQDDLTDLISKFTQLQHQLYGNNTTPMLPSSTQISPPSLPSSSSSLSKNVSAAISSSSSTSSESITTPNITTVSNAPLIAVSILPDTKSTSVQELPSVATLPVGPSNTKSNSVLRDYSNNRSRSSSMVSNNNNNNNNINSDEGSDIDIGDSASQVAMQISAADRIRQYAASMNSNTMMANSSAHNRSTETKSRSRSVEKSYYNSTYASLPPPIPASLPSKLIIPQTYTSQNRIPLRPVVSLQEKLEMERVHIQAQQKLSQGSRNITRSTFGQKHSDNLIDTSPLRKSITRKDRLKAMKIRTQANYNHVPVVRSVTKSKPLSSSSNLPSRIPSTVPSENNTMVPDESIGSSKDKNESFLTVSDITTDNNPNPNTIEPSRLESSIVNIIPSVSQSVSPAVPASSTASIVASESEKVSDSTKDKPVTKVLVIGLSANDISRFANRARPRIRNATDNNNGSVAPTAQSSGTVYSFHSTPSISSTVPELSIQANPFSLSSVNNASSASKDSITKSIHTAVGRLHILAHSHGRPLPSHVQSSSSSSTMHSAPPLRSKLSLPLVPSNQSSIINDTNPTDDNESVLYDSDDNDDAVPIKKNSIEGKLLLTYGHDALDEYRKDLRNWRAQGVVNEFLSTTRMANGEYLEVATTHPSTLSSLTKVSWAWKIFMEEYFNHVPRQHIRTISPLGLAFHHWRQNARKLRELNLRYAHLTVARSSETARISLLSWWNVTLATNHYKRTIARKLFNLLLAYKDYAQRKRNQWRLAVEYYTACTRIKVLQAWRKRTVENEPDRALRKQARKYYLQRYISPVLWIWLGQASRLRVQHDVYKAAVFVHQQHISRQIFRVWVQRSKEWKRKRLQNEKATYIHTLRVFTRWREAYTVSRRMRIAQAHYSLVVLRKTFAAFQKNLHQRYILNERAYRMRQWQWNRMLRKGIDTWYNHYQQCKENQRLMITADAFCDVRRVQRALGVWSMYTNDRITNRLVDDIAYKQRCQRGLKLWYHYLLTQQISHEQIDKANQCFRQRCLQKLFAYWRKWSINVRDKRIRKQQAKDHYTLLLARRTIRNCKEAARSVIQMNYIANQYFERKNHQYKQSILTRWYRFTFRIELFTQRIAWKRAKQIFYLWRTEAHPQLSLEYRQVRQAKQFYRNRLLSKLFLAWDEYRRTRKAYYQLQRALDAMAARKRAERGVHCLKLYTREKVTYRHNLGTADAFHVEMTKQKALAAWILGTQISKAEKLGYDIILMGSSSSIHYDDNGNILLPADVVEDGNRNTTTTADTHTERKVTDDDNNNDNNNNRNRDRKDTTGSVSPPSVKDTLFIPEPPLPSITTTTKELLLNSTTSIGLPVVGGGIVSRNASSPTTRSNFDNVLLNMVPTLPLSRSSTPLLPDSEEETYSPQQYDFTDLPGGGTEEQERQALHERSQSAWSSLFSNIPPTGSYLNYSSGIPTNNISSGQTLHNFYQAHQHEYIDNVLQLANALNHSLTINDVANLKWIDTTQSTNNQPNYSSSSSYSPGSRIPLADFPLRELTGLSPVSEGTHESHSYSSSERVTPLPGLYETTSDNRTYLMPPLPVGVNSSAIVSSNHHIRVPGTFPPGVSSLLQSLTINPTSIETTTNSIPPVSTVRSISKDINNPLPALSALNAAIKRSRANNK